MKLKNYSQKRYNAKSMKRAKEVFDNTLQASQSNLSRLYHFSHKTEGRLIQWSTEKMAWVDRGVFKSVWHIDGLDVKPIELYRTRVHRISFNPNARTKSHVSEFAFVSTRCGGRMTPRTKRSLIWGVNDEDRGRLLFSSLMEVADHYGISYSTAKRWANTKPETIGPCIFAPIVDEDGQPITISETPDTPKRKKKSSRKS